MTATAKNPGSAASRREPNLTSDQNVRMKRRSSILLQINGGSGGAELTRLLVHPVLRHLPDLLRELHRAELRAAHRAEMRELGALGRQCRVVIGARRDRVEREIELILPPELETRPRQRVVPRLRPRMSFRQIGGVGRDL